MPSVHKTASAIDSLEVFQCYDLLLLFIPLCFQEEIGFSSDAQSEVSFHTTAEPNC